MTVVVVLAGWAALSVPVAIVAGRLISGRRRNPRQRWSTFRVALGQVTRPR